MNAVPEIKSNKFQLFLLASSLIAWILGSYEIAAIALVLSATFRFFTALGEIIPIKELIFFLATYQWVLGPLFAYHLPNSFSKYDMAVPLDQYFTIVIPSIIAFNIGLFGFKSGWNSDEQFEYRLKYYKANLAYVFIAIGALSPFIGQYLPTSFRFLIYLLNGFVYAGVLIFYVNPKNNYRNVALLLALLFLLSQAAVAGLFHTLILWGTIFFCFYSIRIKGRPLLKYTIITFGVVALILVQQIKGNYRSQVISQQNQGVTALFESIYEQIFSKDFGAGIEDMELAELNVRLNQGWIISNIFNHVPGAEPFANGATVREALVNSALPRFLAKDKKRAGGQDNFERFTGKYLGVGTSMGISILGESYANFGRYGWLFMLLWGAFISFILQKLINLSKKNAIYYFLIPLIFFQAVKAETELYVVLNHITKSLILVLMLSPIIIRLNKKYLDET